jgi:hypothetical protein
MNDKKLVSLNFQQCSIVHLSQKSYKIPLVAFLPFCTSSFTNLCFFFMFVAVTQIMTKHHTISDAGMLEVYIYIQYNLYTAKLMGQHLW